MLSVWQMVTNAKGQSVASDANQASTSEQAPGPRAIDADRALESQDGVLEDGELQALLGLEARPAEGPVAQLRRQDAVRHELGLALIVGGAKETLHGLYPLRRAVPEPLGSRREHAAAR